MSTKEHKKDGQIIETVYKINVFKQWQLGRIDEKSKQDETW